jgi:hypothetical protein
MWHLPYLESNQSKVFLVKLPIGLKKNSRISNAREDQCLAIRYDKKETTAFRTVSLGTQLRSFKLWMTSENLNLRSVTNRG